jgi:hypothetical protein
MKKVIVIVGAVMAVAAGVFAQNNKTAQGSALGEEVANSTLVSKDSKTNLNNQNQVGLWIRVIETAMGAGNPFPLLVLDGKKISREELYKPDNNGKFTILKGGDATSLYGEEGANGVFVFESKQD